MPRSTTSVRRALDFRGGSRSAFARTEESSRIDLFIVQENGPNAGFGDWTSAADAVSIVYTPEAMRFRGVSVLTNTPPRTAQRGPGQNQIAIAVEPLMDKAARELRVDPVAVRRINAPGHDAKYGGQQRSVTSAYLGEALEQGAERFRWAERLARSGTRRGSKVIGVGVGQAYHSAGSNGFDGLVRLTPDGKLPHPYGSWQPRHLLLCRDVSSRGGGVAMRLGELRHRTRRLEPRPSVEFRSVREQHVLHDDSHELRGRDGRRPEAEGDCRARSGRFS